MLVYLVGGTVRDLLMGAERTDIDFAVEGDVETLARRIGEDIRRHERFLTATVRVDGLEIDLAATRAESYPHPGALPQVRPASLREDLARRDFTINAMAVPLLGDRALIDPHGGLDDLRAGLVRVLHDRSFADDPTRAPRAARYATRYGFALEPETASLVHQTDLGTVSEERVDAELRKLAAEPQAARGFRLLAEWGLLDLDTDALELIDRVVRVAQAPPWSEVGAQAEAVLVAAGGDIGRVREFATRSPKRPSEAVRLARGRPGSELLVARALGAEWLERYIGEWRDVRLEIDGNDRIAAGVPEGPGVGAGLESALARTLDGEISGREDQLEAALAAARSDPGKDSA